MRVVDARVPFLSFLVLQTAQARVLTGYARNADGTRAGNSRHNTGFQDGLFGLPAGHLNPGEGVVAAAVREVRRTRPSAGTQSVPKRDLSLSVSACV